MSPMECYNKYIKPLEITNMNENVSFDALFKKYKLLFAP